MNKAEYEAELCRRIVASMEAHGLKDCASSVILAGSFGRGEATYVETDGGIQLKSDVEVGVVYRSKLAALSMIAAVEKEFAEELCCFPLSPTRVKRLDNFNHSLLPCRYKTLLTYDLVNGHKTIWGEDPFRKSHVELAEVDRYEAKRIVANRIGELVYTRLTRPGDAPRWEAKLVSAIGTAFLLCEGQYECSYRAQMERMRACTQRAEACLGAGFVQDYQQAFACLRQGGRPLKLAESTLRQYVEKANAMFASRGMGSPRVNTLSRRLKYILKYGKAVHTLRLSGIEEEIIGNLLSQFPAQSPELEKSAKLWHQVLY